MLVKWADCQILMKHFDEASIADLIKAYEKIGNKYLQTPLIKSQAKDFFFKSIVCYLAIKDMPGAQKTMEHCSFEDPSFDGSRQFKFLEAIMAAIETDDVGLFQMSVTEYVKFTPFDKPMTALIVEVKTKNLPEAPTYFDLTNGAKKEKKLNFIDGDNEEDN